MSITTLFILCAFLQVGFAQETEYKHPIDVTFENCLQDENNFTTAGMIGCTQDAYDAWDKELNSVYKKLMMKLPNNEKAALKKAQVEWIKFRDLEFENIDSIYDLFSGTMYIPMRLNEKMDLVKRRTLQLGGYLYLMDY